MIASLNLESLVHRLGWVLVHTLWQFALLGACAAAFLLVLRRGSAAVRHAVLLGAMLLMVVAPAATWTLAPGAALPSPAVASHAPAAAPHRSAAVATPQAPVAERLPAADSAPQPSASQSRPGRSAQQASWAGVLGDCCSAAAAWLRPHLATIVAAWCLGVLAFSCRPLLSWQAVRRLRRFGVSTPPESLQVMLRQTAGRLQIRGPVEVRQSTLVNVPVVIGWFRPLILLPASILSGLPAAQLEAVLAHELAHIRRHDYLVNLLQTAVETVFFYHPAVWWLSGRIRVEREHCCDDLAVAALNDRVQYGRALLAIAELRGSATALALGARDGSLLCRVRRISGAEPRGGSTPLAAAAMLLSLALLAGAAALSTTWSVAMAETDDAAEQQAAADQGDFPLGPESHQLRCRLIPVSPLSDDDSPGLSDAAGKFTGDREMTFAVELKNVGRRPLTLLGVRYGDSYPTAKGKLNTAFFAPHLFQFEFFHSDGQPVPRTRREFVAATMVLNGASTHQLAAGESLTVVLRPAQFMPPMQYDLPPGRYRARVRYHGPSDQQLAKINEHWPDSPQAQAWPHEVVSNMVNVAIAADPDAPRPTLVWGPVKDGLQAAAAFRVPEHVEGVPTEAPGVPVKSAINVEFHVKNVGEQPVTFISETGRQGDSLHVTDSEGKQVNVPSPFFTGWPIDVRWHLQPGDVARLPVLSPTVASIEQPGQYTVRYTIRFNSRQQKDDQGNIVFPRPGDWQQELPTGETPLFLRPRTAADEARARPPTFLGRLEFRGEGKEPIETGVFTYQGEIKRDDHKNRPIGSATIEIPDCTRKGAMIRVRSPGFEEAVFYDVKFQPGETKTLQLKRAAASRFRLVSSADGRGVGGAKIRFFNKTSAKASSGPFPTDGIQGPVWTTSQADGQVVLDSLQRIDPYYEKLGDATYFFYVEPAAGKLAPTFVGPLKAGQDLGDVTLGPYLEVRGEVRGTPEELERFAAEWDQPFELTTDNPEAAWDYAVSKRLETNRQGDKLTFHLTGLRPGRLRFVCNFGPRPHAVSHTYGRRDPKESDVVFQVELDKSLMNLVLTPRGDVARRLDKPASLAVSDEPLFLVLTNLEKEHGVPITLSLAELHAQGISAQTRVSVTVNEAPLREVFRRLLSAAGTDFEVTDTGIRIPAAE